MQLVVAVLFLYTFKLLHHPKEYVRKTLSLVLDIYFGPEKLDNYFEVGIHFLFTK